MRNQNGHGMFGRMIRRRNPAVGRDLVVVVPTVRHNIVECEETTSANNDDDNNNDNNNSNSNNDNNNNNNNNNKNNEKKKKKNRLDLEDPVPCNNHDQVYRREKQTARPLSFFSHVGGRGWWMIALLLTALGLFSVVISSILMGRNMSFLWENYGRPLRTFYRNHLRTLHPDTFTHECQTNYLNNDAWGRLVAPHVDKHQVKGLVQSIQRGAGRDGLIQIAPTLAVYDPHNLSLLTRDVMMQNFPQPYLIKPTHMVGGVARVVNDTYECFKTCAYDTFQRFSLNRDGYEYAMKNIQHSLSRPYTVSGPQYHYIPPRVILEESFPMDGLREFQWFTVNGHAVFGMCRCLTRRGRNATYFSAGFRELHMHYHRLDPCDKFEKPGAYSKMMEAVRILGERFPGISRIDLYVNDVDVYFGEITVTTAGCNIYFQPVGADRLLHALLHGGIHQSQVTPEFVERLINKTPWFLVVAPDGIEAPQLTHKAVKAFSSESALCDSTDDPAACLKVSQDVRSFPLRCILVDNRKNDFVALGQEKLPFLSALMRCLEMPLVLGIATVLTVMMYFKHGGEAGNRMRNNAYFFLAISLYNCLKPQCKSLTTLLFGTIQRSFSAFVMVHPMENRVLALVHFATYWIAIAAWRAKTPRRMLFWWLMYEIWAVGLNEFFHQLVEEYHEIQCARMAFVRSMEHHALDETIRQYILPPLFVYGYYLPKYLFCQLGFVDCGSSAATFQTFLFM